MSYPVPMHEWGRHACRALSDRQSGEWRFGTSGAKYEYHVRIRGDDGSLASGHCALTRRAENPMPKLFKQIRQSFGISAPKMTVQTHVAWYLRWLGMLVFLSLAIALAAWKYDAGRRFAGFDRGELQNEFARLRDSVGRLDSEAAGLLSIANASES